MFFLPFAKFLTPELDSYIFTHSGIEPLIDGSQNKYTSTMAITVLISIVCLISLITIFLYNKRGLQVRLSIFNAIFIFALIVLMGLYSYLAITDLKADYQFKFASVIPVISFILSIMAFKKIRKDELLIRSIDRIR